MKLDSNLHEIKKPTPKQQFIIDNMVYPNFVRASAGTGKTEVIVQKILKLLKIPFFINFLRYKYLVWLVLFKKIVYICDVNFKSIKHGNNSERFAERYDLTW